MDLDLVFRNDGFEIHTGAAADGGNGEVWFFFGCYQQRSPAGMFFADQRNCRAVYIVARRDEWYQDAEFGELLVRLQALRGQERGILFGCSMGAFGSIMASKALRADLVICGGAQTTIDVHKSRPHDWRWDDIWSALSARGNLVGDVSEIVSQTNVSIVMAYDSLISADRWHAERLRGFQSVRLLPLPGTGHASFHRLKELGVWRDFVSAIADGDRAAEARVSAICWSRRREGREYLASLGEELVARGRYFLGEKLLKLAWAKEPNHPHAYFWLSLSAQMRGDNDTACHMAALGCQHVSDDMRFVSLYERLGQACYVAGRFHEAKAAYRSGLALLPDSPALANSFAEVLGGMGDREAIYWSERACRLQPRVGRYEITLRAVRGIFPVAVA